MSKFEKFTEEDYKRKAEYDEALLHAMGELAKEFALEDGIKIGEERGKVEGKFEQQVLFLNNLLNKGYSEEDISELMNISKEELNQLKEKI